jgi:pSer/pThr/pTyr-binding forkhead associated (FHA) protein
VPVRFSIRANLSSQRAGGTFVERSVELPCSTAEVVFGRHPGAGIELPFPAVSGRHARFWRDEAGYHLEDLGSANGTSLAGRRLLPHVPELIAPGDALRIADVEVRFEGEQQSPETPDGTAGTETIARRLVHDIFAISPPAESTHVTVVDGPDQGREMALTACGRNYKIGRGTNCDLILSDEDVSREHATVVRGTDGIVVRDLGSKNGIEVMGETIVEARRLCDGDILRIGRTTLKVIDPEERYLRQMQQADAALETGKAALDTPKAPKIVKDKGAHASRLPVVAMAMALLAFVLLAGLVLALVFGS